MKEQFLNLSGLTDLVTYMKLCIAQHKVIIPRASFSLFPETGDENNIYIDTSTNAIYRWNDTDKKFVLLAKPPRTIAISEGTNNGEITLKVDNIASNAKVHGLTSTAFTESNKFATAAQGAKADSAVQTITLSSGTKNGTIKIKVNNITTDNIEVAGLGSAAFSDIGIFAAKSHTHKKDEVGLGNVDNTADIDKSVKYATSAGAVSWKNITDKPTLFPSQQHNHDSLYYRKNEVDSLLSSKSDTGHTHVQFIQEVKFSNGTYSDPLNGTAVAIKASGGIASDLIYEGGKTLADKYQAKGSYAAASHKQAYTSGECTTYNADDNTMGVTPAAVKKAFGIFGPKAHTHKKSDITDFPTSLPASDVYGWAKASSKPSYTKSEVGLGNVDNTADANKSVKYAGSSGSSNTVVYTALTNTDLNTLQTEGRWYYAGGGNTCTNIPVASAAFELYVGRNASGWRYQQFTVTSGEIYIRVFDSSNWGSWRKLAFTSDTVTAASSVPWSGITGKPTTFTPASHTHNYAGSSSAGGTANASYKLSNVGQITTVDTLNNFNEANVFKYATMSALDGLNGLGKNDGIILSAPWSSANYGHQIFLDDNSYTIAHRYRNSGTWSAWKTLIDSSNIGSQSVSHASTADSTTTATQLSSSAGSATQPVYFSGGKPVATTYTLGKSVPSNAVFTDTNTWRGIQNNLTSDSTTDSLSAAQGKVLKGLVDGKAASSHTHTIAQISNLQSTLDGKANNHSHPYLQTSGGTMTGPISYKGTKNTYQMIKFKDNTSDIYGNGIVIGGGGATIIGGGESADAIAATVSSGGDEVLYLCNDGAIDFYTNCQNGASSAKHTCIDGNGNFSGNSSTSSVSAKLGRNGDVSTPMIFNWSGKDGQPSWLWGGSDGTNMYVYNPSNFNVNHASSASSVPWSGVTGKPSTFTPSSHTHSMANITDWGSYIYDAHISRTANTVLAAPNGSSGPASFRKLVAADIPSITKGKITDFPTSLPASDVYAWAKASSKPSYSWSEIGSKPSTFTPSSHNHSYLTLYGSRPANINFSTSTNGTGTMFHFVATSSTKTGKPPEDSNVLQMNWDNNGGWDTQFAISNGSSPHSYIRSQNNGTWGNWTTLLDSSNYNNYSPSKTGTGASGTWGINITGASGSCTGNAATASNASKVNGHTVNSDVPSGAKFTDTNTWRPLGTAANTACAGNDSRLSNSRPASDVYSWAKASSKPSYSWSEITSKPSTFTPASHTHAYIPLSGGTITGSIIRSSGGSWISARNNVAVRGTATGKDSWNPVVGQATPNGYWTIGNLASNDNLAFSYTSNTNYNAGNNSATTVYLPVQEGTIITSATIGSQSVKYATSAGSAGSVAWGNVSGKPSSYTPSSHTHDDRYYTETEINTKLGAKLGAVSANGYYGMTRPDGNTSDWIRTTTAGIIPYQSGGAGGGHCGIGTSSWYFSNAYIDTVNCVNASVSGHIDVGGYIQSSNLINTYFEYQSNRGSVDWRFGAATGTSDENFFGFYDAKTGKIPLALDGNFGNIYVGFNVGSYESPTAVGVYLGGQVAGNRAFIYNGDSYQGSIWIQTRLDGSWKWFSLGRACSTALSDIRLKGNIRDTEVEDATKVIESMKIRSFERKDSHKKYKIGFIADELEQLDPNLVDGGGEVDGHPYYKSVNNLQMLAYVVKGMQELNSKVTILEKENKRLKQKLNMCN